MHVVVVGAGIAGVSTVAALRAEGFDGELTIVEAGRFPHDRPPLSKDYLAGRASLANLALKPESWYYEHAVRLITGTSVVRLDTHRAEVTLSTGPALRADRVVLATGGAAIRPASFGEDHRIHVLRTVDDADRLRQALLPDARILVVGAGLIGGEVAATATELGCRVTLVDLVETPLSTAVGRDVAAWLHGLHGTRGIRTVVAAIGALRPDDDTIWVTLTDGSENSFDAVVVGVGMESVTELARWAGLEIDRGVVVGPDQATENRAVLAVGDAARTRRNGQLVPRSEHWEAATVDGRRAAATIVGAAAPAATAPWFWTDRHGHHVEVVGELARATYSVVRGMVGEPPFSVFGFHGVRLVGAVSVDDPNAVRAARRLIDRAVRVEPAALADPAVDLRQLLRP
jgi:NADPH-dependent 2,4-dienoyl-CoA reductase/sulfur reductase-like enzyme